MLVDGQSLELVQGGGLGHGLANNREQIALRLAEMQLVSLGARDFEDVGDQALHALMAPRHDVQHLRQLPVAAPVGLAHAGDLVPSHACGNERGLQVVHKHVGHVIAQGLGHLQPPVGGSQSAQREHGQQEEAQPDECVPVRNNGMSVRAVYRYVREKPCRRAQQRERHAQPSAGKPADHARGHEIQDRHGDFGSGGVVQNADDGD
jgi:hypothetical protein